MLRLFLIVALVSASLAFSLPARNLPVLKSPFPSAGKIVGGEATTIEDVPYQVAMLYGGSLRCGGSIVRANAVITAAHCTEGTSVSLTSIRAASSNHNSGGQIIAASRVFQHALYSYTTIDYDITVLELASAITFGASANFINLPSQGLEVPGGSTSQTSGWGVTTQGGSVPDVLQKVVIPIVDQTVCSNAYANVIGYSITERMICAGLIEEGGKDACQGDSGGPLVVNDILVGVTSWGNGCAQPGYPGVWARVPALQDWVDEQLSQIASL